MIYDRSISISHGKSRKSTHWQQQKLKLSEMWERLRHPSRSTETLNEYLQLSKAQQDAAEHNQRDPGLERNAGDAFRKRHANPFIGLAERNPAVFKEISAGLISSR